MNKTELKQALDDYKRKSDFIRKATLDTIIKETSEQQERRVKHLLKPENYGELFDHYFGLGTPIPMADSHCAKFHIEAYNQLYKNNIITLFLKWSREFAKSVHSNVGFPFGLMQSELAKFFVTVGINQDRATLLLSDLQMQLESNQRIIADFGVQKVHGSWADGEFETEKGCYFLALGIDQPFRGLRRLSNRVHYANVDDCEDRKVAQNERLVRERGEKILSDLGGAFGKTSERLVISNNFVENKGLVAYLHNKKKGLKYTQESCKNWHDGNYNSPWPERYTNEDVKRKIDNTDPITFRREYMQIPTTEGALFKPEWIRYKAAKPLNEYRAIVGHWDLSYTAEGDYKAMALLGATENEIHVLDVFCRKCDITEAMDYHFTLVKKLHKNGATAAFYYDATAAQQAVYTEIFWQSATKHKCYETPIPEHASVDKYLRIEATLMNLLFNRRLAFADYLRENVDCKQGVEQLLVFEKGSKAHDDFPDTLEAAARLIQMYSYDEDVAFTPVLPPHKRKGY